MDAELGVDGDQKVDVVGHHFQFDNCGVAFVAADVEEFFEAGGDAVLENGAPVFDAPHHVVVTGKDHVAVVAEFRYRLHSKALTR